MSKSTKDIINKLNAQDITKINNLIERGRVEISTKKQLEKYQLGSPISYLNRNNIIKQGGYLYKFGDEWFIFITTDFSSKIRVRYKNVSKMWVGDVYKTNGDIVNLSTKQSKTNFPVKIGDTVVHYAPNTFKMKRFMNTEKYQQMVKWYDYFINKNK